MKPLKIRYMRLSVATILVITMFVVVIPAWGSANSCLDISTDAYGNLFLLNPDSQRVFKFDDNMNFIEESLNSNSLRIKDVDAITVCWCAGELSFSSSANASTQMYEMDENWKYVFHRDLAGIGSNKAQVLKPNDIKYLRSEEDYWIAISDNSLGKVVVIDDFGEFHHEITGLTEPVSTYYSTIKELYIIDEGQIGVYSSTGAYKRSFGKGQLSNPIAIDASRGEDRFYVLDEDIVVVFDSNGNKINTFRVSDSSIDMSVNIFKDWIIVASCDDNGTLEAYDYDGNLIKTVGSALNPKLQIVLRFKVDSYVFYINGEGQKLRCPVRIENDRSLVPVREITESLGGKVDWDGSTKSIAIAYDGSSIKLKIDQPYAIVNGMPKVLPSLVPPRIYCNGVTMVPLRFVSEILGAEVEYFENDKTIEVRK